MSKILIVNKGSEFLKYKVVTSVYVSFHDVDFLMLLQLLNDKLKYERKNYVIIILTEVNWRFAFGLLNYLQVYKSFRRNFKLYLQNLLNKNEKKLVPFRFSQLLVVRNLNPSLKIRDFKIHIVLKDLNTTGIIIQAWSSIVLYWINKKRHYDANWAILSTLGGAYSSLGEESEDYARHDETTSLKQLKLAYDFNDPISITRCKIYLIMSFIQLRKFKEANEVVRLTYNDVKNNKKYEMKLVNMYIAAVKKLKMAEKNLRI